MGNPQSQWYSFETPLTDDFDMSSNSCPQFMAMIGKYMKFLFDLNADPNEKTNLYYDSKYSSIKVPFLT